MKKIDPLRVSQSISRSMMKDINQENYGGSEPEDIKLANRDQEIHIGADNEGDGDQERLKKVKGQDGMQAADKNEMVDIKDTKKDANILKQNGASGKSQSRTNDKGNNDIKKDTTLT